MRGRSFPKNGGQAAQALGRSRGGFSTKIHVSVDGLGNPLRFILTGGQQHDITQAEELIAGYAGEHVLADKGYDAQEFRRHILELGMLPVIPPRSNRKEPADYDRHLYRERHLVVRREHVKLPGMKNPFISPRTAHIFSEERGPSGDTARWLIEQHPFSGVVNDTL